MEHQTIDWGRVEYATALDQQQALVSDRIEGEAPDTLVFTEHPPSYTIGKRLGAARHLLWDEGELEKEGIRVYETNRGGDITYHGPGQIVGYSILDWSGSKDLHAYLRTLEEVLICSLRDLGLESERNPGKTGIWIGPRKVAAIGIAVRRWVTYHGFALNVNPNMEHFKGIVPCGIPTQDGQVTSLEAELGSTLDLSLVKSIIDRNFWQLFSSQNIENNGHTEEF